MQDQIFFSVILAFAGMTVRLDVRPAPTRLPLRKHCVQMPCKFQRSLISGSTPLAQNLPHHPGSQMRVVNSASRSVLDRDVSPGVFGFPGAFGFLSATGQEPVTHAGLGFQPSWCCRIVSKLLAQLSQHDTQVMRVLHVRATPDFA